MDTNIGRVISQARQNAGLNRPQLAQAAGYKNLAKGANKIVSLEREGHGTTELLARLQEALQLPASVVEDALAKDRAEQTARWNQWASQPIRSYLVKRYMPAVYGREELPETIARIEDAKRYASSVACREHRKVCLVWSRRIRLWFDGTGALVRREVVGPGSSGGPAMRVGGKSLLLDDII